MPILEEIAAIRNPDAARNASAYGIAIHVTVVDVKPDAPYRMEVLVQEDIQKVGGIIRGKLVPSGLDNGRRLTYYQLADGRIIIGALARNAIWTTDLHVARFEHLHLGGRVVLTCGNGNLGANDGHLCFVSKYGRDGESNAPYGLFSPADFPVRRDPYACLVAWRDGTTTVEDVYIVQSGNVVDGWDQDAALHCGSLQGSNRAGDVLWVTSGVPLVRNGVAKRYSELIDLVSRGWVYDLNHALTMGWLRAQDFYARKELVLVQVPYEALLRADGQVDPVKIRDAMAGNVVTIDIGPDIWEDALRYTNEQAFIGDLKQALHARAYQEDPTLPDPGNFHINAGKLYLRFLLGTYPHNLVATTRQGRIALLQVTYPSGGKLVGGRSSMTLLGTANAALAAANLELAKYGDTVVDMLCVDNGGDVRLDARAPNLGWDRRVRPELPREALRSLLAVTMSRKDTGEGTSVTPPPTTQIMLEVALPNGQWVSLASNGSAFVV